MSTITVYTEAQTLALALSFSQRAHPGKSHKPGSYLYGQCESLAALVGAIQSAILSANNDAIPATTIVNGVVTSLCSSTALDQWAYALGLPSNRGAGLYGRNGAFAASGGAGDVVGLAGTVVPSGAYLVDSSGTVRVRLGGGVTIGVGGTVRGGFYAATAGAAGNLAAGTVISWESPVAGCGPSVTLDQALSGGYDIEDDTALVLRLLRWLQTPPRGGTAADYRFWAENAVDLTTGASLGIYRAYVYPRRSGLGTEDIVIVLAGTGQGRDPLGPLTAKVQAYIDSVRPVNDRPTVLRPRFATGEGLRLLLKVKPALGFSYDWIGVAPIAITGATTSTIAVATADVPADLAAAIAAGRHPRVQVSLPNTSPIPVLRPVLSSAAAAGTTTLTLDTSAAAGGVLPGVPLGWVWPGGSAAVPVALACLAYVDQVGPSRASGYADTVTDDWEDLVSVGKIAQAALGASDAAGGRVLAWLPGVGIGVGIKIGVGAAAYSGDDYVLTDSLPGQPPQMPWVSAILVIP